MCFVTCLSTNHSFTFFFFPQSKFHDWTPVPTTCALQQDTPLGWEGHSPHLEKSPTAATKTWHSHKRNEWILFFFFFKSCKHQNSSPLKASVCILWTSIQYFYMIFFLTLWSRVHLVKCTGWVWTNTHTCANPTLITVWSINTPEVSLILYPAYPFPSQQRQPPSSMLLLSFRRVLKPHKWAHLMCTLLPKASFTQHHTFQTDACWPLSTWSFCFCHLLWVNKAAVNIHVQPCVFSFGWTLQSVVDRG